MSMSFGGSGSGEHVDFENLDLPGGLSALTILAWVKFDNFTTADQRIISKATDQQEADHWFMFSGVASNQMRARLKTGVTTTHLENTAAINTGEWYHMGFVYNGATIQFYRNGAGTGSSAKTGTVATSGAVACAIADNPGPVRKELAGSVDDCRIYTRALSLAEVNTIYRARGRDNVLGGLHSRWTFSEAVAGTAAAGASTVRNKGTSLFHGTPASTPTYASAVATHRRRRT